MQSLQTHGSRGLIPKKKEERIAITRKLSSSNVRTSNF